MPNPKAKPSDDEYKEALQPFVDEAMSPHNLAPAIQVAITRDKPLNDELQKVVLETVQRNPDVQKALDEVITNSNAVKKSRLDYRQPGFWIPIAISIAGMVLTSVIAIFK